MIVREIKDDPEGVLATFDWFNDYEDTIRWAQHNCPELVGPLIEGHMDWVEGVSNRLRNRPRRLTKQERFDRIMEKAGDTDSNDEEISNLREICETMWQSLDRDGEYRALEYLEPKE